MKEEVKVEDRKHRWALIPDGSGKMHLIDLNPFEAPVEPFFNAENDVFFMLFTQRNPTNGQRMTIDADLIRNSNFNPAALTRLVIHGWNNDHQSAVNTQITAAYLQKGDFNVVSEICLVEESIMFHVSIRLSWIGALEPTLSITSRQDGESKTSRLSLQDSSIILLFTSSQVLTVSCLPDTA